MTQTVHSISSPPSVLHESGLHNALRLAALFALIKLLLQFALTLWTTHLGYGYFRDEFYYLACGHHLAWGYVDHGPVVALQARLGELLFGDSIFGSASSPHSPARSPSSSAACSAGLSAATAPRRHWPCSGFCAARNTSASMASYR